MRVDSDDARDAEIFAATAIYCRVFVGVFLKTHFGERCKEYEHGCECCKRWKLLDDLLENPFK